VAIKTLRQGNRGRPQILKLLREAWVTGALEHPNVLPIYDVDLDDDGCPRIVLKRIEGDPWSALLASEAQAKELCGDQEPFEFHLGVLMQVCRAVSFAHSRGIVHRDLKPDNVMVGRFGEVYLLDWGIAVSLRDDSTGRFPLAKSATELAGTPCYMAPEMLGADLGPITERTDIYLLGAVLHEILTGTPPHDGAHARAVFASVLLSRPKLDASVAPELAAIVRRAMSGDPTERHASAEELRAEIAAYLRHRGAMRLAERAEKKLAEMSELLAGGASTTSRAAVYKIFGECRFGFREALEACPMETKTMRAGPARSLPFDDRLRNRHRRCTRCRVAVGRVGRRCDRGSQATGPRSARGTRSARDAHARAGSTT
jgi:serine/threonine-protein kinase